MSVPNNILQCVLNEYDSASSKFEPFNSAHEGYAVLAEEVDELWDEVKGHDGYERTARMRNEAVQVAAMALRFLTDITPFDVKETT